MGCNDFVKNIVRHKRSANSRKCRPRVGKANKNSNDDGVAPGFPPNLVDTLMFGNFFDDGSKCKTRKIDNLYANDPYENSVHNCLKADEKIDANGRKEARMKQGENKSYAIRNKVSSSNKVTVAQYDLQCHSDMPAQAEDRETVEEKEIKETEDEVTMLLKEQHWKNQGELARVVRQQEEILRLMALREKRDEELRQLLTSVLRNQKDQYLKNQEELRHVARQQEEILRLLSLREKRDE